MNSMLRILEMISGIQSLASGIIKNKMIINDKIKGGQSCSVMKCKKRKGSDSNKMSVFP